MVRGSEQPRLKKLYDKTYNQYRGGAYYDARKRRFVRYWASNTPGYTKYLRRQTNKKIRRSDELYQGGLYKKAFEYWWAIF